MALEIYDKNKHEKNEKYVKKIKMIVVKVQLAMHATGENFKRRLKNCLKYYFIEHNVLTLADFIN